MPTRLLREPYDGSARTSGEGVYASMLALGGDELFLRRVHCPTPYTYTMLL